MYTLISGCSAVAHLLAARPVLIIALGVVAASAFVRGVLEDHKIDGVLYEESVAMAETSEVFLAKIDELTNFKTAALAAHAPVFFDDIMAWESQGRVDIGLHGDGVSWGKTGLTKDASIDVRRALPNCEMLGYNEILSDPYWNEMFARFYFYDLIHRFRDTPDPIKTATISYNFGPTRTARYLRQGKRLPEKYWNNVTKE